MGDQTTVVLVGFVLIHVALVFAIIGVSTPVWIKAAENSTQVNSTDENITTKGLWEICEFGECSRLNQSVQTGEFVATQVLFTLGGVELLIGTLGMYVYLAAYRKSKRIAIVSTVSNFIAWAMLFVAVVIFGDKEYPKTSDLGADVELSLGWSYWCAVAANVFAFLTFLASGYRCKILADQTSGYEDI